MSQPLLNGEVEYVDSEPVADLRLNEHGRRITELEDRIANLEAKIANNKRDAVVALLQMLSDSMRHIASGKMDIPDVTVAQAVGSSKWDALKRKYAGTNVEQAIDALLIHGKLTTVQLAANLKVGRSNAYNNIVPRLIRLGIITRQGADLVLRES